MNEWERKDCPACRDVGRVTSKELAPDEYENWCERCHVQWITEEPVEVKPLVCDYCVKTISDLFIVYVGNKRVCNDCFEELRGE
jgi:hypothetical protein